eukprot:m.304962 g.304962  ORF g.304962 m.304962 type:complete len:86 (-) comp16443_c7_seq2:310-567(-)
MCCHPLKVQSAKLFQLYVMLLYTIGAASLVFTFDRNRMRICLPSTGSCIFISFIIEFAFSKTDCFEGADKEHTRTASIHCVHTSQ